MSDSAPTLRLVHSATRGNELDHEPELDVTDFDAVYRRYAPYVAGIGLRLLGRQGDADELVQDVFLCVYKRSSQLRDPAALRPWLKTIAVREAYRQLKRRRARRLFSLDQADHYDLPDERVATPQQREQLKIALKRLDELPAKISLPWRLRVLDGEKLEEIARLCDCSLATVKRRIQKAQQHIQSELP